MTSLMNIIRNQVTILMIMQSPLAVTSLVLPMSVEPTLGWILGLELTTELESDKKGE